MLMQYLGNEAHGVQEEGKQEAGGEARKDGSHVVQCVGTVASVSP